MMSKQILKRFKLVCLVSCLLGACSTLPGNSLKSRMESDRLVKKGIIFLRTGDLQSAKAAFETAYEVGKQPAALDGIGSIYYFQGNYKLAGQYFIASYKKNNKYLRGLANLARVYEKTGLYNDARSLYEYLLAREPENFQIRNNFVALLHEHYKESEESVVYELKKALVISNDPLVKTNLDKVLRGRDGSGKEKGSF